jgi:hypothetical protein
MAKKRNVRPAGGKRPPKAPKLTFETIARDDSGRLAEPYELAFALRRDEPEHADLLEVSFYLVWKYAGTAEDKLPVNRSTLLSPHQREKSGEDFFIVIPHAWWTDALTSYEDKVAYLDDAFCQVKLTRNEDGDEVRDPKGRLMLHRAQPDFSGYLSVVRRRGAYTRMLESVAAELALRARGKRVAPEAEAAHERTLGSRALDGALGRVGAADDDEGEDNADDDGVDSADDEGDTAEGAAPAA